MLNMFVIRILINFVQELRVSNGFGGIVLRYLVINYLSFHYMLKQCIFFFLRNPLSRYCSIKCQEVIVLLLFTVTLFWQSCWKVMCLKRRLLFNPEQRTGCSGLLMGTLRWRTFCEAAVQCSSSVYELSHQQEYIQISFYILELHAH